MAIAITDDNIGGLRKKFDKEFESNLPKFRGFICKNLTELRERRFSTTIYKGRPHEQLLKIADVCGISYPTIKKVESGVENFTIETLLRLLQFYDIPPKYIMYPKGIDEYQEFQKPTVSWASTKLSDNIAHVGWKEVSFYFDGTTPVMKKTDGTIRDFLPNDTVVFDGSLFKSFKLTFDVDENGKTAIFHNIINTQSFRTIGLKTLSTMNLDYAGYPVCSTVLTLCWLDEFTFKMEVRRNGHDLDYYLKQAGLK